jgi:exosortase/archaeosortase family protein
MFKITAGNLKPDWAGIKPIAWYIFKFGGIFCFLYFGTLFIVGSGVEGGSFYFPWVYKHFYYLDVLRDFILRQADFVLELLGYETRRTSIAVLRIGRHGISLNDACLGYGLMSFWIAFVVSDIGPFKKKVKWLLIGLISLNIINVLRVCLIILAGHHKWVELPTIDHHMMFNIAAYILIFIMIYFYSKNNKNTVVHKSEIIHENNVNSRGQA